MMSAISAVAAALAFVVFMDITGTGAADADAATNTADLAKTRARPARSMLRSRTLPPRTNRTLPGSSADQLLGEAKAEREAAAHLLSTAEHLLTQAAKLGSGSGQDD